MRIALRLSVRVSSIMAHALHAHSVEEVLHQRLLRVLQAPTPESDNNPFLVFRMRAKPNRPQTRRRRETQEESLDKIRSMQQNLGEALRIAEMVRMREAKKGEMLVRVNNLRLSRTLLLACYIELGFPLKPLRFHV